MNREQSPKSRSCKCGGDIETIGACRTSEISHCKKCHECILEVWAEELRISTPLSLFFHARLDNKTGPSNEQVLSTSRKLFSTLVMDRMPDELTRAMYGIESPRHLGTLQQLTRAGVTATAMPSRRWQTHCTTTRTDA